MLITKKKKKQISGQSWSGCYTLPTPNVQHCVEFLGDKIIKEAMENHYVVLTQIFLEDFWLRSNLKKDANR